MKELFDVFPYLENEIVIIRKMEESDVSALSDEYSCVVKPQFREIGNRLTGTWEPPYASLLAHVFV